MTDLPGGRVQARLVGLPEVRQAEDRALAQAILWVPMIRRLNLSAQ